MLGGSRRGGARHRNRLEGAVVDNHVAGTALGQRRVGEIALDRHRGLRILALAQVVPDRQAAVATERVLQPIEHLRGVDLAAAALSEQLALDRVESDHVVARPGLRRAVRLAELGVDALHEHVDVVQEPAAAAAVALAQDLGLLGDLALGLPAGLEGLQPDDQVDGPEPRSVDGGDPGVVARLFEQQRSVLGERPARAEGHVIVGLAVDVRHVEGVADDAHALARALGLERTLPLCAQLLGLEEAEEIAVVDVVEERRERVVHPRLAIALRRHRHPAVLPGRNDVARGSRVVAHRVGARDGDKENRHDGGEPKGALHRSLLNLGPPLAARPVYGRSAPQRTRL